MSEQKRNRDQAYNVVMEALNLAQDLSYLSEVRDPSNLKLTTKLSRRRLLEIIKNTHGYNVTNTRSAYALVEMIGDWADEYPVEEQNK